MLFLDKDKDQDKLDDEHEIEEKDSKYYVPEEELQTVFQNNKQNEVKKVQIDEEEEEIPQASDDYIVNSKIIKKKTNI